MWLLGADLSQRHEQRTAKLGEEAVAHPCLDLSLTPSSSGRVQSCLEKSPRTCDTVRGRERSQRGRRSLSGRQEQPEQNKLSYNHTGLDW